jgi:hypothetical protein
MFSLDLDVADDMCGGSAGSALHIGSSKSEHEPTSGGAKHYERGHLVRAFRGIERKLS